MDETGKLRVQFESPYLVYFELNEIEFQIKSFKWCQEVNFISMSMFK